MLRSICPDWLVPVVSCTACGFLGLLLGLRCNRPQPAIPQALADTLGHLKAEVTVVHELAGAAKRQAYRNFEQVVLLRQRLDGRKSVCPHEDVLGKGNALPCFGGPEFVGIGDDGLCPVCRPATDGGHFVHQDDPDGTRHGVYANKDGWYAAIDQIKLHRLRVRYGSETCDTCGKDTP